MIYFSDFSGGGGGGPTPPTATYEYDLTGTPWHSQATYSTALYDSVSDKTYVAWEAQCQFRHTKVAAYDHTAGTWSTPVVVDSYVLTNDNHGMPALELLSDGRLVCFYGSHVSDQNWAISAQSGGEPDITTWTRQTALTGGLYTYPKPVNVSSGGGAGTLYLLMRKSATTNSTNAPLVLRSAAYTSGGSVTFGTDKEIINFSDGTDGRVYAMEARLYSGNIEFMATRAEGDDTLRQNVYYFRYMVATGAIENLSGGTSTASGSQPINLTTANTSYREKTSSGSNVTGVVSWCRDTNGYLHIAYGDDTTSPWNVTHDWHNGSSWQGATTAFTVPDMSGGGYTNEWCLVPRGTEVDAYYPANNNGGFTFIGGDDIGKKTWSGSWGSETIVLAGDEVTAVGLPSAVRNAHADLRVIFTEAAGNANDTSLAALKRYFYGDSGFVEWPEPSDPDAFKNILVLNFEGANNQTTYSDESGWKNRHPITFSGNAKLDSSTAPPWGTTWLRLDGTGDYLSIPESRANLPDGGDWQWRAGDTLEIVFRPNSLGVAQVIASNRSSGTSGGFQFFQQSDNTIEFLGFSGSTTVVTLESTSTVTTGQSYTIAVTRKSDGTWGLRFNGTEEDTAASATLTAQSTLWLGRYGVSTSNMLNGWIKQVRWTKMASRDLSVVPTAHFPVS